MGDILAFEIAKKVEDKLLALLKEIE